MNDFLRVHEFNIDTVKFRHSGTFRFKNKKHLNKYTNQLILDHPPYIYRQFEDDRNCETLQIMISWTILVFLLAFLLIISAFFFISVPLTPYIFSGTSMVIFITGVILKNRYEQFAWNIDFTRSMLTDELIENVKETLKSSNTCLN